jgi:succinate-semialdehyde dehydrogenase/glutarate-semialdehyde dehydrogenase
MAYTTTNPATGEVEKTFDNHTPDEVETLLARAVTAFDELRQMSFTDRARLMVTAAELVEGEQPEVARVMTTEMGKTFAAAKAEASKCAMSMRWFAENAERLLSEEEIPTAATRSSVRYEPLGPILAVMPWNFPLWQVMRFAAPTLMAGNVGLLKHASNVPQTALFLEDVFRRAGFPAGAFTTLLIDSSKVAGLVADDRVAAVTLTGSEAAGRSVGRAAGEALKKVVLELGGSDPFIVLPSADLSRTVPAAVRARVQNNGQSCIAAKRFIVAEEVADEFTARFAEQMGGLVVGDPFDPATDVGPLSSEAARDDIAAQVDDAREKGATVLCGGTVPDRPGWYYPPTVLTGVVPGMRVFTEETFGPVAVVERAADLDEVIALANSTPFGLGSSVWTSDPGEQRECIRRIDAGQVFVNAIVASTPELPFGGIKLSGYGRELSGLGIREFCNAKTVWVD